MSLSDFIANLQNKPRHIRVASLWVSVGICMIAIFSIWIFSLGINSAEQPSEISSTENESSPASPDLKNDIPSLWQSLKASVSEIFQSDNGTAEQNGCRRQCILKKIM